MKTIGYEQLCAYLEEHDILCGYQSGFRAIFYAVTAVMYIDLKKGFDTVDHNILLSKLDPNGTSGNSLKWLQSYLENRTQQCSVSGSLSDSHVLTCSVSQLGEKTILGSLLFLSYINEIPNCLSNCEPRMCADDRHLTYADND